MDNVKYVNCREKYPNPRRKLVLYYFKVSNGIADYIRNNAYCSLSYLECFFTEQNEIILVLGEDKLAGFDEGVIKSIENICNSVDEDVFLNHLMTDMGKLRTADKIHGMLKNEFGLINEAIEMYVADFLINLTDILYSPEYDCEPRINKPTFYK